MCESGAFLSLLLLLRKFDSLFLVVIKVIPSPSPSIPHLKTVLCVAWLQLRWLSLGSHAFAVGVSRCKAHRVGFWWDGCHSRGPAGPIYPSV